VREDRIGHEGYAGAPVQSIYSELFSKYYLKKVLPSRLRGSVAERRRKSAAPMMSIMDMGFFGPQDEKERRDFQECGR
jgi:hypothetical protein